MKVGGKCLSMISIYLLPDCLDGGKVEEDGREPGGLSEWEEESACGGYGIGWLL